MRPDIEGFGFKYTPMSKMIEKEAKHEIERQNNKFVPLIKAEQTFNKYNITLGKEKQKKIFDDLEHTMEEEHTAVDDKQFRRRREKTLSLVKRIVDFDRKS